MPVEVCNVVYLDDILVFSATFNDHLEHLRAVFDGITKAGMKIKVGKTKLVRKVMPYLGHVLTPEGVRPDISKGQQW